MSCPTECKAVSSTGSCKNEPECGCSAGSADSGAYVGAASKPTFLGCVVGSHKWSDYFRYERITDYLQIPRGVEIKWGDVPGNRPYDDDLGSCGRGSYHTYYSGTSGDPSQSLSGSACLPCSGDRRKPKNRQSSAKPPVECDYDPGEGGEASRRKSKKRASHVKLDASETYADDTNRQDKKSIAPDDVETRPSYAGSAGRDSVYPEGRQSSVYPEGRQSSVYPEGRQSSVYPESRKSSVYPEGRQSSVYPEGRQSSVYPESRKSSVYPEGRQSSVFPEGRQSSVKAQGRQSSVNPEGRQSSVYPKGRQSSVYPEGRQSSVYPEGRQSSVYPEGRQSSVFPEGRQSSVFPEGRQSSVKPQGRQSSVNPEGRQSLVNQEGRQSSVNPEGRQSSVFSQGRQSSVNPEGRQSSVYPEGRQSSVFPEGRQSSVKPQRRQSSVNPEGRQSLVNQEGRQSSVNPEGRQSSVFSQGRQSSVNPEGRQSSVYPEGRQSSVFPEGRQSAVKPQRRQSLVNPEGRQSSVNQEGRQSSVNQEGRQSSVFPEGRQSSVNPEGRQSSVNPEGRQSSVFPEGRQSSVYPEGRQSSVFPEGRQSSVNPEGRQSSVFSKGRQSSVNPEGRQSSVFSQGRQSSVNLEGRQSSVNPEGRQSSVFSKGRQSSVNPEGRQSSVFSQGRQSSVNPEGRQSSVSPEGRQSSVFPEGRQSSVYPEGRQSSVFPEGRQSSVNPEGRQSSVSPEGRQSSVFPEGRQSSVYLEGRQSSVFPEGRQVSVNPEGRQSSVNSQGRQSSVFPEGRQSSVNSEGRQPSVNPEGRQSSVFPEGRQSSVYSQGRQSSVNPEGRQSSQSEEALDDLPTDAEPQQLYYTHVDQKLPFSAALDYRTSQASDEEFYPESLRLVQPSISTQIFEYSATDTDDGGSYYTQLSQETLEDREGGGPYYALSDVRAVDVQLPSGPPPHWQALNHPLVYLQTTVSQSSPYRQPIGQQLTVDKTSTQQLTNCQSISGQSLDQPSISRQSSGKSTNLQSPSENSMSRQSCNQPIIHHQLTHGQKQYQQSVSRHSSGHSSNVPSPSQDSVARLSPNQSLIYHQSTHGQMPFHQSVSRHSSGHSTNAPSPSQGSIPRQSPNQPLIYDESSADQIPYQQSTSRHSSGHSTNAPSPSQGSIPRQSPNQPMIYHQITAGGMPYQQAIGHQSVGPPIYARVQSQSQNSIALQALNQPLIYRQTNVGQSPFERSTQFAADGDLYNGRHSSGISHELLANQKGGQGRSNRLTSIEEYEGLSPTEERKIVHFLRRMLSLPLVDTGNDEDDILGKPNKQVLRLTQEIKKRLKSPTDMPTAGMYVPTRDKEKVNSQINQEKVPQFVNINVQSDSQSGYDRPGAGYIVDPSMASSSKHDVASSGSLKTESGRTLQQGHFYPVVASTGSSGRSLRRGSSSLDLTSDEEKFASRESGARTFEAERPSTPRPESPSPGNDAHHGKYSFDDLPDSFGIEQVDDDSRKERAAPVVLNTNVPKLIPQTDSFSKTRVELPRHRPSSANGRDLDRATSEERINASSSRSVKSAPPSSRRSENQKLRSTRTSNPSLQETRTSTPSRLSIRSLASKQSLVTPVKVIKPTVGTTYSRHNYITARPVTFTTLVSEHGAPADARVVTRLYENDRARPSRSSSWGSTVPRRATVTDESDDGCMALVDEERFVATCARRKVDADEIGRFFEENERRDRREESLGPSHRSQVNAKPNADRFGEDRQNSQEDLNLKVISEESPEEDLPGEFVEEERFVATFAPCRADADKMKLFYEEHEQPSGGEESLSASHRSQVNATPNADQVEEDQRNSQELNPHVVSEESPEEDWPDEFVEEERFEATCAPCRADADKMRRFFEAHEHPNQDEGSQTSTSHRCPPSANPHVDRFDDDRRNPNTGPEKAPVERRPEWRVPPRPSLNVIPEESQVHLGENDSNETVDATDDVGGTSLVGKDSVGAQKSSDENGITPSLYYLTTKIVELQKQIHRLENAFIKQPIDNLNNSSENNEENVGPEESSSKEQLSADDGSPHITHQKDEDPPTVENKTSLLSFLTSLAPSSLTPDECEAAPRADVCGMTYSPAEHESCTTMGGAENRTSAPKPGAKRKLPTDDSDAKKTKKSLKKDPSGPSDGRTGGGSKRDVKRPPGSSLKAGRSSGHPFSQVTTVGHVATPRNVEFYPRTPVEKKPADRRSHDRQVFGLYSILTTGTLPDRALLHRFSDTRATNNCKPPTIEAEDVWNGSELKFDVKKLRRDSGLSSRKRELLEDIIGLGKEEGKRFHSWSFNMPLLTLLNQNGKFCEDSSEDGEFEPINFYSEPESTTARDQARIMWELEKQRLELVEMKRLLSECVTRLEAIKGRELGAPLDGMRVSRWRPRQNAPCEEFAMRITPLSSSANRFRICDGGNLQRLSNARQVCDAHSVSCSYRPGDERPILSGQLRVLSDESSRISKGSSFHYRTNQAEVLDSCGLAEDDNFKRDKTVRGWWPISSQKSKKKELHTCREDYERRSEEFSGSFMQSIMSFFNRIGYDRHKRRSENSHLCLQRKLGNSDFQSNLFDNRAVTYPDEISNRSTKLISYNTNVQSNASFNDPESTRLDTKPVRSRNVNFGLKRVNPKRCGCCAWLRICMGYIHRNSQKTSSTPNSDFKQNRTMTSKQESVSSEIFICQRTLDSMAAPTPMRPLSSRVPVREPLEPKWQTGRLDATHPDVLLQVSPREINHEQDGSLQESFINRRPSFTYGLNIASVRPIFVIERNEVTREPERPMQDVENQRRGTSLSRSSLKHEAASRRKSNEAKPVQGDDSSQDEDRDHPQARHSVSKRSSASRTSTHPQARHSVSKLSSASRTSTHPQARHSVSKLSSASRTSTHPQARHSVLKLSSASRTSKDNTAHPGKETQNKDGVYKRRDVATRKDEHEELYDSCGLHVHSKQSSHDSDKRRKSSHRFNVLTQTDSPAHSEKGTQHRAIMFKRVDVPTKKDEHEDSEDKASTGSKHLHSKRSNHDSGELTKSSHLFSVFFTQEDSPGHSEKGTQRRAILFKRVDVPTKKDGHEDSEDKASTGSKHLHPKGSNHDRNERRKSSHRFSALSREDSPMPPGERTQSRDSMFNRPSVSAEPPEDENSEDDARRASTNLESKKSSRRSPERRKSFSERLRIIMSRIHRPHSRERSRNRRSLFRRPSIFRKKGGNENSNNKGRRATRNSYSRENSPRRRSSLSQRFSILTHRGSKPHSRERMHSRRSMSNRPSTWEPTGEHDYSAAGRRDDSLKEPARRKSSSRRFSGNRRTSRSGSRSRRSTYHRPSTSEPTGEHDNSAAGRRDDSLKEPARRKSSSRRFSGNRRTYRSGSRSRRSTYHRPSASTGQHEDPEQNVRSDSVYGNSNEATHGSPERRKSSKRISVLMPARRSFMSRRQSARRQGDTEETAKRYSDDSSGSSYDAEHGASQSQPYGGPTAGTSATDMHGKTEGKRTWFRKPYKHRSTNRLFPRRSGRKTRGTKAGAQGSGTNVWGRKSSGRKRSRSSSSSRKRSSTSSVYYFSGQVGAKRKGGEDGRKERSKLCKLCRHYLCGCFLH